jgi:hypothetical protein
MPLTHLRAIVPAFSPMPSGVGDYALLLAGEMRRQAGIQTSFIVTHPSWDGASTVEGFPVRSLRARQPDLLAKVLAEDNSPVVLHYSGYGFHNRGCPIWLWRGLRHWRRRCKPRLITMLHEISASGPPWTSAFWLGPAQHFIAGRIVVRSQAVLTSREAFSREVDRFRRGRPPRSVAMPVFSNIGEPEISRPIAERQRRVVVFGSPPWRIKAYTHFLESLEATVRAFGAVEVADIGPPWRGTPRKIGQVPVRAYGRLESDEVLGIMGDSVAGFVCYPADFLAKSGIFASYTASGLVPVTPDQHRPATDGLRPGHEFLLVNQEGLPSDTEDWQRVSDAARAWYAGHSLPATARAFLSLMDSVATGEPVTAST